MNISFVPQSIELITEHDLNLKVEKAYRMCYQSLDKVKDTPTDLVGRILAADTINPHLSPLEHVRICISCSELINLDILRWQQSRDIPGMYMVFDPDNPYAIRALRGNLRAFKEYTLFNKDSAYPNFVNNTLAKHFPQVFTHYVSPEVNEHISTQLSCKFLGEATDYATFKIVTSRNILQQLSRHRVNSLSVESTRYCNYAKKGFTFIKPTDDALLPKYTEIAEYASKQYLELLDKGYRPEVARDVLPGFLKTELYVSATKAAWKHFVQLRDTVHAQKEIAALATYIKESI